MLTEDMFTENQVRPSSSRCAPLSKQKLKNRKGRAKLPWMNSPCKLQAQRVPLKPSRVLAQTPRSANPLLLKMVRPSPLPHKSQVKNESPNALFPPFGLLIPTLKDQWPRLDLAMSNQWMRLAQIISLRKPTFLSHFMSINSPTL